MCRWKTWRLLTGWKALWKWWGYVFSYRLLMQLYNETREKQLLVKFNNIEVSSQYQYDNKKSPLFSNITSLHLKGDLQRKFHIKMELQKHIKKESHWRIIKVLRRCDQELSAKLCSSYHLWEFTFLWQRFQREKILLFQMTSLALFFFFCICTLFVATRGVLCICWGGNVCRLQGRKLGFWDNKFNCDRKKRFRKCIHIFGRW